MTQLPGLLIEYLVNGSIALVWFHPLLDKLPSQLPPAALPAILIAALYVVGMAVDVTAWAATRPFKPWVRKQVHKKCRGTSDPSSASETKRLAKMILHAPELSREFSLRSSRDRIARGTIVNSVMVAMLVQPWWFGVLAAVGSIVVWVMFEKLSYMFELCAEEALDEKLRGGHAG